MPVLESPKADSPRADRSGALGAHADSVHALRIDDDVALLDVRREVDLRPPPCRCRFGRRMCRMRRIRRRGMSLTVARCRPPRMSLEPTVTSQSLGCGLTFGHSPVRSTPRCRRECSGTHKRSQRSRLRRAATLDLPGSSAPARSRRWAPSCAEKLKWATCSPGANPVQPPPTP